MNKRKAIIELFEILDDIDTADDMAKNDDHWYRDRVRQLCRRRFDTGVWTDGYGIYIGHTIWEKIRQKFRLWHEYAAHWGRGRMEMTHAGCGVPWVPRAPKPREAIQNAINIMMDDPSTYTDEYLRGMCNGIVYADCVLGNTSPVYIDKRNDDDD